MPTSAARLGYENLLEAGTFVASSEDASFPVANVADWRPSDFFKPTSVASAVNITLTLAGSRSADYFGFYNHNLHLTGGTIKLQYWNGSSWVDCFSAITPTDNSPRFISFTSRTSTQWRVVITATSIFSIAVISFGAQLALEYGMYLNWTTPVMGRDTKVLNSQAENGNFLGRSLISKGVKSSIILQGASDTWIRANWMTFIRHAEQKPFFFLPDLTSNPLEAAFCWTDGEIPPPTHTNYGFMGATIPIRGMVE